MSLADVLLIDTDTHVSEPPDLWTSRVSDDWKGLVPHVIVDDNGRERWSVGTKLLEGSSKWAAAGWTEYPPSAPPTLAEADPGSWDPAARLERMDEYGIFAQVLYPNILAFYMQMFMSLNEPEFVKACVIAYNDFLTDFASEDTRRLVPLMVLPYWDIDASVAEIKRCAAKGHKGIVFGRTFEKVGLPKLWNPFWNPIWEEAQRHGLSINFHVGFVEFDEAELSGRIHVHGDEHTRATSVGMMGNAYAISDVITMGLCHRYPDLNFVSVESGVGWLPYLMESLDWHWCNYGARDEHPEMELPSFYFKRQVYGSFWFEKEMVKRAIEILPDNLMFESDYPHPTSLSPGPRSIALVPRASAERSLEGVPEELARKVMYENAARLYHL
jgi:predicted TIM-barrel fold metal-dependent hydrolase